MILVVVARGDLVGPVPRIRRVRPHFTLGGVGALSFGSLLLLTGWFTVPNNPDSLAYHLPRIMQWFQAGRVSHFATDYAAQSYLPPSAELVDGWLLALFRTDRAMFLAQWTAWVCTGLAVWKTAGNLGVRRSAVRAAGVVVALCAPAVLGEAATTQNDLVATAAVVAALAFVSLPRDDRDVCHLLWAVPLLLGAAVAVKPPVALIGVGMVVWWACRLPRLVRRRTVGVVLLGVAAAALLNAGWMTRNVVDYGSVNGPDVGLTVRGDHARALPFIGIENLTHEVAVPGPASVNEKLRSVVGDFAATVTGAERDDPRFSYAPLVVDSQRNEDKAGNVLQFVLFLAASVVVLSVRGARRRAWPLLAVMLTGYAASSALVRYQPWGGRMMLPLLTMTGVVVAVALQHLRLRGVTSAVVVLALLQGAPWLLAQKWRPLVGSRSTVTRGDFGDVTASMGVGERSSFARAIKAVNDRHPRTVGLVGEGSYADEYVWWRYLDGDPRISNVVCRVRPTQDVLIAPWNSLPRVPTGYRERAVGTVHLYERLPSG